MQHARPKQWQEQQHSAVEGPTYAAKAFDEPAQVFVVHVDGEFAEARPKSQVLGCRCGPTVEPEKADVQRNDSLGGQTLQTQSDAVIQHCETKTYPSWLCFQCGQTRLGWRRCLSEGQAARSRCSGPRRAWERSKRKRKVIAHARTRTSPHRSQGPRREKRPGVLAGVLSGRLYRAVPARGERYVH
ncbi:hypothetical protein ROHU_016040 [Labeo rohita]|uniref:Uncharacterized protein n=1 Tax=Labeo rohita TaxID=84645 RepID=A0A498NM21_LABRO|nr:hypothetical protein ROHU_016040 [Labeo rohita]